MVVPNNLPIPPNPLPVQAAVLLDEPHPAVYHTSLLNSLNVNPQVDNATQEGDQT
ncbi:hypothetical protein BDV93DRAFT_520106 [Ceratobasidium sp. AG-I]|nr:hypothetical protein BDV93DRAFT_520106 [Ceratobasidium sp. AG-I]